MISKERHDIHIACKKGKRNLGRKREKEKKTSQYVKDIKIYTRLSIEA
jgi:hypothetical protein